MFNVEFTQFSNTFEEFYGGRINNVRLRRDIGNEFYHILDLNSDVLLRQPMAIGPYLEEILYNPVVEDHLLFNFCFERGYLCQKCQSIDRRIAVINRNLYLINCERSVQECITHESTTKLHKNRVNCTLCSESMINKITCTHHGFIACAEFLGNMRPSFIDRFISIHGVKYNLLAVIYFVDGNHFILRFYRKGKIFEANSHHTVNLIPTGISTVVPLEHEFAFPGLLNNMKSLYAFFIRSDWLNMD